MCACDEIERLTLQHHLFTDTENVIMSMELDEVDECNECGGMGSSMSGDLCGTCGGGGTVAISVGEDDTCECCGLPRESCSCPPGCPNCSCGGESFVESFGFDKFMDQIILKEGSVFKKAVLSTPDSPQRERARRHQEKPINRIRYRGE